VTWGVLRLSAYNFQKETCSTVRQIEFFRCAVVLYTHLPKKCSDLYLAFQYTLKSETYSKFARKVNFLALGVCFSQTKLERWPHLCCVKIMFTLLPTNCVVSTTTNSIKCVVNWTPLRICVRSKIPNPTSRWGWVFIERTQILSAIQFTTRHFIKFVVMETKRFVGSSIYVLLTRQTCGQRSSRAAESKRWALENYFSEQICYMFLISKCKADWELGRCTFWVFVKRKPLRNAKFRFFLQAKHVSCRKSPLRGVFHFASTKKVEGPSSHYTLHFDIMNI